MNAQERRGVSPSTPKIREIRCQSPCRAARRHPETMKMACSWATLFAGSALDEVGSSFLGSLDNELTLIHPLLLDRRAQYAPGLGLRDEQEVGIAAVDPREVEAKDALASAIKAGGKAGVAKPDHLVRQAAQLEQLQRARCTPTARDVVAGADWLSMMRTAMPRRDSSSAAVSPVGPAPTIRKCAEKGQALEWSPPRQALAIPG